MRIENIVKGLQIMIDAGASGYCLQAEHDQIWAGDEKSDINLTDEQKTQLDILGWFFDKEVYCWSAYV